MQSGKTTYKTRESLQDIDCICSKQFVQRTKPLSTKIYFGTSVAGTDAADAANAPEAPAGAEAAEATTGAVAVAPSTPAEGFARYAPR
jgi:hypothetical protein